MNKKRIGIFFLLLCLFCTVPAVSAQGVSVPAGRSTDGGASEDVEDYILDESWKDFFDSQPLSLQELKGKNFIELCRSLLDQIRRQLTAPLRTAAAATAVLMLIGLFKLLCSQYVASELEYTLQSVMTSVIFLLVSKPALQLVESCQESFEECRVFLAQFVPVMGSILAAGGQTGTAAVYTTLFFGCIMTVSEVLYHLAAPVVRLFLALSITQGMCGSLKLDSLIRLIRRLANWVLGGVAALFGTYLSFQSILANAGDSLAMKAGKLVFAGGIPIIGGAVSDAVGTVYAGLRLVKNAAGLLGIAVVVLLFLPALVQCSVYGFTFRLCGALARLMENEPARGLLEGAADSLDMLTAILVLYQMLTILSTALMILLNTGGI